MIKLLAVLVVIFIFVSPFFLFIKLVKRKAQKQMKTSWKGKLEDKRHFEYEDEDGSYSKTVYSLFFRTSEGQQIKINVPLKIYNNWKVGDKANKTEGNLHPEKIS